MLGFFNGIMHQNPCPNTRKQNGVTKKKMHVTMDVTLFKIKSFIDDTYLQEGELKGRFV